MSVMRVFCIISSMRAFRSLRGTPLMRATNVRYSRTVMSG